MTDETCMCVLFVTKFIGIYFQFHCFFDLMIASTAVEGEEFPSENSQLQPGVSNCDCRPLLGHNKSVGEVWKGSCIKALYITLSEKAWCCYFKMLGSLYGYS